MSSPPLVQQPSIKKEDRMLSSATDSIDQIKENIFADNLRRELLEKWLQRSGFLVLNHVSKRQNR
jgi:hypothetical protein